MSKRIINIQPGESIEIRVVEKKEKDFYTVREIADMVGLNYYTIQRHITEGKLVGNKLGRSHKISQENLNKYLNNK
jgi:excisionase family DNA binding protein